MAASSEQAPDLPNVYLLRHVAKDMLVHLLESVQGKKDLVLGPNLMRPLDRIAGAKLLREHGVDKIFKLEANMDIKGCDQRIYLVHPTMFNVKLIADQVNQEKTKAQQGLRKKLVCKIIFTPRKLHVCDKVLEEEGVFGDVVTDEFKLDLIPIDQDILSLELPEYFRDFFLEESQMWQHTVASSLNGIQQLFGPIPCFYALGKGAKMVQQMFEKMPSYGLGHWSKSITGMESEIGHVFLIDRSVDYVTPLCSQVTYEGLLDEVFGIQSGCIEFGHEVSGRDQPVKLMLTSQDEIFEEIRNRHFTNVFSFLSGKAKEVQSGYDKRHQLESVRDMKDFVANDLKDLKQQHKSLALFIGASEVIMSRKTKGIDFEELLRVEYNMLEGVSRTESINYIEERLNRQFNCLQTLRLLCLLSLTQDGIPPKEYKSLKTQFLHAEGYDWMLTFHNLKKLGLLKEQVDQHSYKSIGGSKGGKGAKMAVPSFGSLTWKSSFQTASKSLKLIPKDTENLDLRFPTDMSYVFGGAYTPLSCKLVEQILNKCSFEDVDPVLKTLSIPRFSMMPASARFKADPNKYLRVVLVYFLGGCTYSEITALRFLGKVKGYKFIIATTSIITGARLLDQVTEVTPK